jgi:phosphatidylglycerophosphatase A
VGPEPGRVKPPIYTWYGAAATFFGVGGMTKMRGAIGTPLAFLSFLLFAAFGGINIYIYVLPAVILLGVLASGRYAAAASPEFRDYVVIDRVAGYWVAMLGLEPSYSIIVVFLFGIAGVLKPFPVERLERLPGGLGIMAGDIAAGVIINLIMRLLSWLFFDHGFEVIYRYLGIGA